LAMGKAGALLTLCGENRLGFGNCVRMNGS
jgi:hypothetical protein